jgi:hypothetical protein
MKFAKHQDFRRSPEASHRSKRPDGQPQTPFFYLPSPAYFCSPVKKDRLIRSIMLLAGFIAVAGILGSQSLFHDGLNKKAATEQSADTQQAFIHAPGDAIPGHSVQVDDSSAFHEITTIFEAEEEPELPTVPARKIGQLFKLLFRTLIAPNAP